MSDQIVDIFETSNADFVFYESDSDVDGVHVIAKVRGPACFDGAASRNKRWYPEGHWTKQFVKSEVQKKLKDRLMFGAWGHERELTDEELADGKHSHITTRLWMEGKTGLAEYLILNTPAGRILNTTLRAKSKLSVSTRGSGAYKEEEHNGLPVIDSDNYNLERVDFVVNPGFLQACPDLVETLREDLIEMGITLPELSGKENNKNQKLEDDMPAEFNEQIIRESVKLRADLELALKEREELKASNTVLADQNENYRKNQSMIEGELSVLRDKVTAYEKAGANDDLKGKIERLTDLEEMFNYLVKANLTEEKEIKESGKKIVDAFNILNERNKEFKKIIAEFGSYKEIKKLSDHSKDMGDKIAKFGTIEEIGYMSEAFESLLDASHKNKVTRTVSTFSHKYGVPEGLVEPLLAKGVSESEIEKMITALTKGHETDRFKKDESDNNGKNKARENSHIAKALSSSFGERLMSSMTR